MLAWTAYLMLALVGGALPARADDARTASGDAVADGELVVRGNGNKSAAMDRTLDRDAVEALPARSADDFLLAMPGLHQSAHGGRGKADQYLLRGFDAVHGADLAVDVNGVPINEVSNVHAHGYLDLHFIPPVLVRQVDLHPGTASANRGDFAVAGAASFDLGLDRAGGLIRMGGGTDRSGETTLAFRPANARPGTFLVADADLGQGVGASRSWRQLRAAAGYEGLVGGARARGWILAYDGAFESPGVLREDTLQQGDVTFYDAYVGSGGGRSTRVLASGQITGGASERAWQLTGWAGWRQLGLQQNFTGWYDHPDQGDGTEQQYRAVTGGALARWARTPLPALRVTNTTVLRIDHIEQIEDAVTPAGVPWMRIDRLQAIHASLGSGTTLTFTPRSWLVVEPGVRAEAFTVVVDQQALSWAPVLAPKLRARVQPADPVELFASVGRGFRSADARGVTPGARAPIATAESAELGATVEPTPWLGLRAAGFGTLVSDEIVFDHVTAKYLTTGETRRLGVDGGMELVPIDALRITTDVTWSDGRYVATDVPIPYAPRLLVVAGVYAERLAVGAVSLTAGLRAWRLGPRAIPGGFVTTPATALDFTSTVRWMDWGVSLDVDNVAGSQWRDGEFVYASQWNPSGSRSELPARHFTAGSPRAARLAVSRRF